MAKVDSDLVARDQEGKPYTVRYEAVNAMLLNEFLKAHRRGESEAATIAQMKSTIAAQQEQIKSLMGSLKEQAIQIQTVADQVALNRTVPVWSRINEVFGVCLSFSHK